MDTVFRIASVTQVLKDLLNSHLIANNVQSVLTSEVKVSSISPGLVDASQANEAAQLNLFLYRISPNTGWSNNGYPYANSRGEIISNPPLALNLHYLMSAFSENELFAEILLGIGMRLFHEKPVVDRSVIRKSLSQLSGNQPSELEKKLIESELAEQLEQIKIVPEAINAEEVSKLWTAFQTRYRPCTAYLVTTVIIENDVPARKPLPVKEQKVFAVPLQRPVIEKIFSKATEAPDTEALENQPILEGYFLLLKGKQLNSEELSIRIDGEEIESELLRSTGDSELQFQLPDILRPGPHTLQILHYGKKGTELENYKIIESNLKTFLLSPKIEDKKPLNQIQVNNDLWNAECFIQVAPKPESGQKIFLLLNQIDATNPQYYHFPATPPKEGEPPNEIKFAIAGIRTGLYAIRLQIDGVESPFDFSNHTLLFAPAIKNNLNVLNHSGTGNEPHSVELEIEVFPGLHKNQKVILQLVSIPQMDNTVRIFEFPLPPSTLSGIDKPVKKVNFKLSDEDLISGTYRIYVIVDGSKSPDDFYENGGSAQINLQ